MPPTKEDWAYLAAFLDGEGSIYVNVGAKNREGIAPPTQPRISFTSTHPRVLLDLRDIFGVGRVICRTKENPLHAPTMYWRVARRGDIEFLLRGMYPYLRIKKEQARVAYQLLQLLPHKRHELAHKLSLLNKRGPK